MCYSNLYPRFKTRIVNIGDIPLGGNYPIRIQSMTNTNTQNTHATVSQAIRLIKVGCEYIRISTPTLKDAENLINIKKALKKQGFNIPIIADVHFSPKVAEFAAKIVEKVRINPGNYYDRKKSTKSEISNSEYNIEIERIRERLIPLIKICKEYGTALRIGSNHGSLSDRILNRYGNTSLGMVEAVMEFLQICSDLNFHNIVVSVKSADPIIMVHANRLLAEKMKEKDMKYPVHLGVTEAGSGEDGIIKSAVGIGTLLEDGIGDTIRVSLTGAPEKEIPIAKILAERYSEFRVQTSMVNVQNSMSQYNKRKTYSVSNIGGNNVPIVINNFYERKVAPDKSGGIHSDFLYISNNLFALKYASDIKLICNYNIWKELSDINNVFPYFHTPLQFIDTEEKSVKINFISARLKDITEKFTSILKRNSKTAVLILETSDKHRLAEIRQAFIELINSGCKIPVIIKRTYHNLSNEEFQIYAATDIGALFIDGFGDGVWLETIPPQPSPKERESEEMITSFSILQATKTRITSNEYISCPTCARTTFNIAEVLAEVKEKTSHLKGLKIAVMGCIVNGIGEMGNADYGVVGVGKNLVNVYKKQRVVKKHIPAAEAVDELLKLIEH